MLLIFFEILSASLSSVIDFFPHIFTQSLYFTGSPQLLLFHISSLSLVSINCTLPPLSFSDSFGPVVINISDPPVYSSGLFDTKFKSPPIIDIFP